MNHVFNIDIYRKYRMFDCVVCRFLWDPKGHFRKRTCEEVQVLKQ